VLPKIPPDKRALFAQPETFNELIVAVGVLFAQIRQQSSPLHDQTEKTMPSVIIVLIGSGVLRELIYPVGKQSYLNLGRACVSLMLLKLINCSLFLGFIQIALLCC
jgi:hypothetical protein